jgi:hypothetical protein
LDVNINLLIHQLFTDESAGIREVIIIPVQRTPRDANGIYALGQVTPVEAQ